MNSIRNLFGFLILIIISVRYFVPVLGESGNYTDVELNALKEFRPLVKEAILHDYQNENSFLIRFLRAKNLSLNEASAEFRENLKWRKDKRIDGIDKLDPIIDFNPLPYVVDGFDKEGYPLAILTPTHIDLRRILVQGNREKLLRHWYQFLERTFVQERVASKKFGKEITKFSAILDLHGFNLRQHFCLSCISVLLEFFTSMEKYYPQPLRHLIVINVPRIALPLLRLIRPLLSPSTDNVWKIFPPDRPKWSAFLHEIADADQLPYKFGGTRKD